MTTPIFAAKVYNGNLILDDQNRFKQHLHSLPERVEVIVRPPSKNRSNQQNRYYHGVVVKLIAETTGNDCNDIHEFLKKNFLSKEIFIKGELVSIAGSTAKLRTVDFEDYMARIRQWASDFLNCFIPTPNEADY